VNVYRNLNMGYTLVRSGTRSNPLPRLRAHCSRKSTPRDTASFPSLDVSFLGVIPVKAHIRTQSGDYLTRVKNTRSIPCNVVKSMYYLEQVGVGYSLSQIRHQIDFYLIICFVLFFI